jgi:hypothetical protein
MSAVRSGVQLVARSGARMAAVWAAPWAGVSADGLAAWRDERMVVRWAEKKAACSVPTLAAPRV